MCCRAQKKRDISGSALRLTPMRTLRLIFAFGNHHTCDEDWPACSDRCTVIPGRIDVECRGELTGTVRQIAARLRQRTRRTCIRSSPIKRLQRADEDAGAQTLAVSLEMFSIEAVP